ncbi:2126_t:CDS:10, partial [Ambispora gerdemannii]
MAVATVSLSDPRVKLNINTSNPRVTKEESDNPNNNTDTSILKSSLSRSSSPSNINPQSNIFSSSLTKDDINVNDDLAQQGRLSVTSISNLINHDEWRNKVENEQQKLGNSHHSKKQHRYNNKNINEYRKRKQLDNNNNNSFLDEENLDERHNLHHHNVILDNSADPAATALLLLYKRRRVSISENTPSPVPSAGFEDIATVDDGASDDLSSATIISNMPPSTHTTIENGATGGGNSHNNEGGISTSSVGGVILPPSTFSGKQIRKKPYIPRPPNSFILYRQHHHPLILNQNPGINNSEISRIIADHWRNLNDQDKQKWKRKAEEAKEHHMKAYPDYKYQPRRRVGSQTTTFRKATIHTPNGALMEDSQGKYVDNFVNEGSSLQRQERQQLDDDHAVPRTDILPIDEMRMLNGNNNIAGLVNREMKRKDVVIINGGSKELRNIARTRATPIEALKAKLLPRAPSALLAPIPSSHAIDGNSINQLQSPSNSSSPQNYFIHSQSSQPPPTPTRLPPPHTLIQPLQSATSSSATTSLPPSPINPITKARGAMIVLEGCEDGSGSRSLQANKLLDFLKNEGIKAKLWKFPDHSTPSGNALQSYQQSNRQPPPKTLHLLTAAHWWELMPTMKDHLLNGTTLIVDGYVNSSIAASIAHGLELHWSKSSYAHSLSPDLVFFLNMSGTEREQREQQQREQNSSSESTSEENNRSSIEWQRRRHDAMERIAEGHWKTLDASKSNTLIHAQMIEASIEVIEWCRKCNTSYGTTGNNNILPMYSPPLETQPSINEYHRNHIHRYHLHLQAVINNRRNLNKMDIDRKVIFKNLEEENEGDFASYEKTLACGHFSIPIRLITIFADQESPELPQALSISGFSRYSVKFPVISMHWITLGTRLKDEHEDDIFYMLFNSLTTNNLVGVIPLANDWYGIIEPNTNKNEGIHSYLSILPQGTEHQFLIDPNRVNTNPSPWLPQKSYTTEEKITLPKPDIVEKYGTNLPYDETRFNTSIDQCRKIIQVFHNTILRDDLISVLRSSREKYPNGNTNKMTITKLLREFGDHQFDDELEDEEAAEEYMDRREDEDIFMRDYNDQDKPGNDEQQHNERSTQKNAFLLCIKAQDALDAKILATSCRLNRYNHFFQLFILHTRSNRSVSDPRDLEPLLEALW